LEAENAACGLRVSLGSQTTKLDVERFIECWTAKKQKMELRRAS
jgi:cysteine sulfinate desulfinase/cysteine desulfurase-like protein